MEPRIARIRIENIFIKADATGAEINWQEIADIAVEMLKGPVSVIGPPIKVDKEGGKDGSSKKR